MENTKNTIVGVKYGDDFDRSAVEFFRELEKKQEEDIAAIPLDDPKRDARIGQLKCVYDIMIYFRRGERAEGKEKYIRDRIEEDRKHEALLASVQPQTNIPCLRCQTRMTFDLKTLETSIDGKWDRVLLMYSCPNKCIPGRAFYDNGEEWHAKKNHCEKCNATVQTASERKGDEIIFTDSCPQCGHVKRHVMELGTKKQKLVVDENYAEDRARFCMTDKELYEYTSSKFGLLSMKKTISDVQARMEAEGVGEVEANVRMIRIMELQTLITEVLEKESFLKVSLSDPTNGDGLRVKISAFDNDAKRTDDASKKSAKTALEDALSETNWRLVKGSINVTLGALAGEIKGYTSETEVRNLIKAEKCSKVSRNTDKNSI